MTTPDMPEVPEGEQQRAMDRLTMDYPVEVEWPEGQPDQQQ